MALEVTCGTCGKRYRADERYIGKKIKCKNCEGVIAIVGEAVGAGSAVPEVARVAEVRRAVVPPPPPPAEAVARSLEYAVPGLRVPAIAPIAGTVSALVGGWLLLGFMQQSRIWLSAGFRAALGGTPLLTNLLIAVAGCGVAVLLIWVVGLLRPGSAPATITILTLCSLAAVSILALLMMVLPMVMNGSRPTGVTVGAVLVMLVGFAIYALPVPFLIRVLKDRKGIGAGPSAVRVAGCRVIDEAFLVAIGVGTLAMVLLQAGNRLVGSGFRGDPFWMARTATWGSWFRFSFVGQYQALWVLLFSAMMAGGTWWWWWTRGKRGTPPAAWRLAVHFGVIYLVIVVAAALPGLLAMMRAK